MIPTKRWTLLAVCLATFMLLLDITLVNVALPEIQRELQQALSAAPAQAREAFAEAAKRAFIDGLNMILIAAAAVAFPGALAALLFVRGKDFVARAAP